MSPCFYENPYETYAALRAFDPVHRCADGSYFLTRFAHLDEIYRDRTHFSSDKQAVFAPKFGAGTPLYEHHTRSLVFNDPPYHTRVRRQIVGALSPNALRALQPGLGRVQIDTTLYRPASYIESAIGNVGLALLIGLQAAALPVGILVVAALAGGLLQHRPVWTFEPLMPQFSRLSPGAGLKRILGLQAFGGGHPRDELAEPGLQAVERVGHGGAQVDRELAQPGDHVAPAGRDPDLPDGRAQVLAPQRLLA